MTRNADDIEKAIRESILKKTTLFDGAALENMAGKRIRDIYYKRSKDGSVKQIVIISTDLQGLIVTMGNAKEELISSLVLQDKFSKMFEDTNMDTVYSSLMECAKNKRVRQLLHILWSKANTSDYDKAEWKELDEILKEAGF